MIKGILLVVCDSFSECLYLVFHYFSPHEIFEYLQLYTMIEAGKILRKLKFNFNLKHFWHSGLKILSNEIRERILLLHSLPWNPRFRIFHVGGCFAFFFNLAFFTQKTRKKRENFSLIKFLSPFRSNFGFQSIRKDPFHIPHYSTHFLKIKRSNSRHFFKWKQMEIKSAKKGRKATHSARNVFNTLIEQTSNAFQ